MLFTASYLKYLQRLDNLNELQIYMNNRFDDRTDSFLTFQRCAVDAKHCRQAAGPGACWQ